MLPSKHTGGCASPSILGAIPKVATNDSESSAHVFRGHTNQERGSHEQIAQQVSGKGHDARLVPGPQPRSGLGPIAGYFFFEQSIDDQQKEEVEEERFHTGSIGFLKQHALGHEFHEEEEQEVGDEF